MSKEKQIDGATLAVLNCYRNKYYADGNNTEQGIVANAINDVLPTLVEFKNGCYRKQSEGEWKIRGNEKTCSLCQFIYYSNNDEWNYCPNCGARMSGGKK